MKFPFQPSQDLSPIYEEIHGGSRSSVSSGSGSGHHAQRKSSKQAGVPKQDSTAATPSEHPPATAFSYSKYDFEATDKAVMLAMKKGQVVRILPEAEALTNNEWCYVEDRDGNKGYVPRQYLKPYRF